MLFPKRFFKEKRGPRNVELFDAAEFVDRPGGKYPDGGLPDFQWRPAKGRGHAEVPSAKDIPPLVRSCAYGRRSHCDCRGHFQPGREVSCHRDVR
jgi:hypothetical protein